MTLGDLALFGAIGVAVAMIRPKLEEAIQLLKEIKSTIDYRG